MFMCWCVDPFFWVIFSHCAAVFNCSLIISKLPKEFFFAQFLPWIWHQGSHRLFFCQDLPALWVCVPTFHFPLAFYGFWLPCVTFHWCLLRRLSMPLLPLCAGDHEQGLSIHAWLSLKTRIWGSQDELFLPRNWKFLMSRWSCDEFADGVDCIRSWFVGNLTISLLSTENEKIRIIPSLCRHAHTRYLTFPWVWIFAPKIKQTNGRNLESCTLQKAFFMVPRELHKLLVFPAFL